jgi:hypothetical protein
MRRAALCLYFSAMATLAFAGHRVQEFSGVTAKFRLLDLSIRPSEPLKIEFTLHNSSDHSIEFRHLNLLQHIDVFCCGGERVMRRLNAPFFESAAYKISLKPGETLRRREDIALSVLYDLAPGHYDLCFKYDLRLLPSGIRETYRKRLHSQDWVTWDDTGHSFEVRP